MRRSRQLYLLTLPPSEGCSKQNINTVIENKAAKKIPGRSAAKYNLVMETSASTPKSIRLIEGGIRIPKVPPAAMEPK